MPFTIGGEAHKNDARWAKKTAEFWQKEDKAREKRARQRRDPAYDREMIAALRILAEEVLAGKELLMQNFLTASRSELAEALGRVIEIVEQEGAWAAEQTLYLRELGGRRADARGPADPMSADDWAYSQFYYQKR
jgi:hypothetical protein